MKRPFAVIGLTLFFTMTAVSLFNRVQAVLAVSAVAFVLLVAVLIFKKCRRSAVLPTVFLSVLAGCLLLLCARLFLVQPAQQAQNERARIVAVAQTYPERASNPSRRYVVARIKTINSVSVQGKIRLSLPVAQTAVCDCTLDIEPGDTLEFVGKVYPIANGDAEIQRSFFSRGVFLGAYPTDVVLRTGGGAPLRFCFLRLRHWMTQQLNRNLPGRTAGLCVSVLFGDKSFLPNGVYDAFKRAGVAHIMAVSGLHLSIWTFLCMALLARRRGNKRRAAAVAMVFVFSVMALAGFSGSVLRAGLMLLVYLGGFLVRRTPDSLNSLGFAAAVLLCFNPLLCMNVGFTLSVLSTLAILVFALPLTQPLTRTLERFVRLRPLRAVLTAMLTTAAISLCVSVVTLPVQVFSFGTVSTVSVLSNLLLLPAVLPLIVCSGLFIAVSPFSVLLPLARWVLRCLTRYCIWAAQSCGHLPFAVLNVPKNAVWFALLFSAAACGLLLLLRLRIEKKRGNADHLLG